ncbi:MAG: tubulin-like doman-containing protein [Sulfolobaceae archaeon]
MASAVNYPVIVGLGSTGCLIVDRYIEFLKQNNINIDDYDALFVCYDTDAGKAEQYEKKYRDKQNVIIYTLPETVTVNDVLSANPWLSGEEKIKIRNGAGNKRAIGYALYKTVEEQFLSRITSKIEEIINKTKNSNFIVVIISSLGGGTGSGTFLHFAMDLSKRLRESSYNISPTIIGIGILPHRNEENIYRFNAYNALMELDLLYRKGREKGGKIEEVFYPFLTYFLVSLNVSQKDTYDDMDDRIVNFIFDITGTSTMTSKPELSDITTRILDARKINSHISTFNVYKIYVPISGISWLHMVGKRVLNEVKKDRNGELGEKLKKMNTKIGEINSNKKKLIEDINNLEGTINKVKAKTYKKYLERLDKRQNELNEIRNELNQKQLRPIDENKLDSAIKRLEDYLNDVYEEILGRSNNIGSYEYPLVPKILLSDNASNLIKEVRNLADLALRDPSIEEMLKKAITPFYSLTGNIGSPTVYIPQHLMTGKIIKDPSDYEIEFLKKHTKEGGINWIVEDQLGRKLLKLPVVSTYIINIYSSKENLENPIISKAIRELKTSASRNVEGKANIAYIPDPYRTFEIVGYYNFIGIYPYLIEYDNGTPVYLLKDLEFLKEGYDEYLNIQGMDNKLDALIDGHTLFYDRKYEDEFNNFIGQFVEIEDVKDVNEPGVGENRKYVMKVAHNLSKIEPEDLYIQVWGLRESSKVYKSIEIMKKKLEEFEQEIENTIDGLSSRSIPYDEISKSLKNIRDIINALRSGIYGAEIYAKIEDKNKVIKSDSINSGIRDIKHEITELVKKMVEMANNVNGWEKKLNDLDERLKSNMKYEISEINKYMREMRNRILPNICDEIMNKMNIKDDFIAEACKKIKEK